MYLLQKIKNKIISSFFRANTLQKWQNIEYFDELWKKRIKQMSKFIKQDYIVIDLGCGEMWTKDFLPNGCTYIPVDYRNRGTGTIICDFNKNEFPDVNSDVAFVSGTLEYIKDYNWFIKQIALNNKECIISYCTLEDFPNIHKREEHTWVNNLKKNEIVDMFKTHGFELKNEDKTTTNNSIFYFVKK